MSLTPRRRPQQQGSALIEFLFASILLILPLLFGTFVMGMRLVRANQVSEVCRDAGHIFAYGVVDFSQPSSQALLVQLASGLNMTATGGNGVIILSTVTFIGPSDCQAAGYSSGSCPNLNNTVFTKRIVIGNAQLQINNQPQSSAFGTPDPSIVDSSGNIANTDYCSNPTAIANNFSSVIALVSGQYAYVAEAFFQSPDFDLLSPSGITSRSIF